MSRPEQVGALDLVPGNTRLRARLGALLAPDELATAASAGLPALATALSTRGFPVPSGARAGPALRSALLVCVDNRRNDLLRAAVAAYSGRAGVLVEALLEEDDRADLVTMLRGAAAAAPAPVVLAAVRAVGRFDRDTVAAVVSDEPAALVPRLLARRLPDPETALAVGHVWRRFELHRDSAELEASVAAAHAMATERRLRTFGPAAAPVLRHLHLRRDAVNVVAAVRLRAAEDPTASPFLPAGRVPHAALRAIVAGREAATVVTPDWRRAVAAAERRGADALARAVDEVVDAAARNAAWRSDPLGASVPVAYVAAVRREARELRRVVVQAPEGRSAPVPS